MHFLLRTPNFAFEAERWSYGISSDQWSLRSEEFKCIYFCIPLLPEQTAIVRFLDYIDRRIRRVINARQKQIKLLEEYKQAIIHQAVTGQIDVRTGKPYPAYKDSGVEWLGKVPEHWEVRRLGNVVEMRVSNVDKHSKEDEQLVRLCNYLDVYKNERIHENMKFMRATASEEEIKKFHIEKGDILITKDSEDWNDIGVPAIVESSALDLICGYHLAILRPSHKIQSLFLFRSLQSQILAYQFHINANGVTRYGLSHNAIKTTLIFLPPLEEQKAITGYLDTEISNIEIATVSLYREIELLHEYRERLIADVVTGKLDVREMAEQLPEESEQELEEIEIEEESEINDEEKVEAINEDEELEI
jgi:type I restriction enzyme S subunit